MGIVIAAIVAIAILSSLEPESAGTARDPDVAPPEHGSACAALERATLARTAGDPAGSIRSVHEAAGTALDALQRDGVIFGEPERISLELDAIIEEGSPARVDRLLERAESACRELGTWSG